MTVVPIVRPIVGSEEREAVDRVMRSGQLTQGPEVQAFEQEFSDALVAGRPCVAVNSGTAGEHLGLVAAGVGVGDEVIVPSFTFAATANSVALTGATPVFADIEPDYFCIDPEHVSALVTDRTVGIMPVHLFGHPADMSKLGDIAERRGLQIYEDAAQAHGATWRGQPVGSFGEFAMFSLYASKNMMSGEGGMVSCASQSFARTMRLLRNQGMEKKYENEIVGFNARMTDLQAAIGRSQLRKLERWTEKRRENGSFYDTHLENVTLPRRAPDATHVYHQYTIRITEDRDGFLAALREEHGVEGAVYYPIPNHRLPSYDLSLDLPVTERAASEVLSIPVHPALTDADLERVVLAVNAVARAGS